MSAQGLANIRAGVAKRMAAQGKAASETQDSEECCLESCGFCCGQGEMGESEEGGQEQVVIW